MKLGEAKDLVRYFIGKQDLPDHVMTFFMDGGRREVEKRHNLYWMRNKLDFSLVVDQVSYSITSSGSGGLNLPNFKDVRIMLTKLSTFTSYSYPPVEFFDFEKTDTLYATDDTGETEMAVIDNETLFVFPPKPDKTYDVRFYYWEWIGNPSGNTLDDELLKRFPEVLLYAATYFGVLSLTKDNTLAAPWLNMMNEEMVKLKRYSDDRAKDENLIMEVKTGPFARRSRRRNVEVWV